MGLLALDVVRTGVVMSSDSQDVVLTEGRCEPIASGHKSKEKIFAFAAKDFSALVGYVGTEKIGAMHTRAWLQRFARAHSEGGVAEFCERLAVALSHAWEQHALDTGMWVFVAGFVNGESYFWYIVNALGQSEVAYTGLSRSFRAVNDLEKNYLPQHMARGLSRAEVLEQVSFHFRNGAIFPGAAVFDAFAQTVAMIVRLDPRGFGPYPFTLERYAYIARQRMEFLKRLYSPTHGLCDPTATPMIDGKVFVYAMAPDGTVATNPKIRQQSRTI